MALTAIAALLKRHIRGSDLACRYGGEELALVRPDVTPGGLCSQGCTERDGPEKLIAEFRRRTAAAK